MERIDSLRNPELYSPRPDEVRIMETHMSWILLADPYAYKIKKPLDLGFADFTTLAQRRHFCEEELRLNRPLAPQLYLDVVPVTGSRDAPALGGPGPAIEYAVKMRQFPQSQLFKKLLDDGRLSAEAVDQLARTTAAFHRTAARAGADGHFGTPEAIRMPVEANFRELANLVDDGEQRSALQSAEEWARAEFAARRADFLARRQSGLVRECHGDMHLGNIILLDGQAVLFDRIEFNEDFRWIDVMSDLAFALMDLEYRGRRDLAFRLLNAYLEETDDYAGLAVLPYYRAYRAAVRAKVAAIRAQQEADAGERQRTQKGVSDYLQLAADGSQRRRPLLAITHGLAGSGKTSGTQALVEKRGAIRVRSDIERKRLAGLETHDRSGSPLGQKLYTEEITRQTYASLAERAEAVIRAGMPAIVDASFLRRRDRDTFRRLAQRLGVPLAILHFHADDATLRRRLAARRGDASEAGLAVLDHQRATQEPLEPDEQPAVVDEGSLPRNP